MYKLCVQCFGVILFLLPVAFTSVAWAVPNSEKRHQEKIQEITQQLQSHALLAGDFKQVRKLQGFTRPIESAGIFIYWRGQGLYWETRQPFPQASTFMRDGVIDWQRSAGSGPRITSNNPILNKISSILMSLIGGDLQKINRSFKADWTFGENDWSIKLDPAELMISRTITDIQITGHEFIRHLVVTTANNDITEITFFNITSKDMPDQTQCGYFQGVDVGTCTETPKTAVITHSN